MGRLLILTMSVADRLARALLAVPALSRAKDSIFHAYPHAGNLLYDRQRNELVILDWALMMLRVYKKAKNVVLLVLTYMMLRDAEGMAKAIEEIAATGRGGNPLQIRDIREHINHALDALPLTRLPGPMDCMR